MLLFMRGALFLGGGRIVVAPSWIEVKEHGQGYRSTCLGSRINFFATGLGLGI